MPKRLLAALFLLGLAACGVVPLPSQSIPDVTLSVPLPLAASDRVLYQASNAFARPVSDGAQRLRLSGNLHFSGSAGVKGLAFFIAADRPRSGCVNSGQYLLCSDAAGGVQIGTASVSTGQTVPISLSGPTLDAAAHAGQGYLGVRLTSGSVLPGDTLSFTNLLAGAYF